MDKKDNYKRTIELNPETSPSTSSVTCFDGMVIFGDKNTDRRTFIEIADCHGKVRLFKYENDSWQDFITKLRKLADTANEFAEHCEEVWAKELMDGKKDDSVDDMEKQITDKIKIYSNFDKWISSESNVSSVETDDKEKFTRIVADCNIKSEAEPARNKPLHTYDKKIIIYSDEDDIQEIENRGYRRAYDSENLPDDSVWCEHVLLNPSDSTYKIITEEDVAELRKNELDKCVFLAKPDLHDLGLALAALSDEHDRYQWFSLMSMYVDIGDPYVTRDVYVIKDSNGKLPIFESSRDRHEHIKKLTADELFKVFENSGYVAVDKDGCEFIFKCPPYKYNGKWNALYIGGWPTEYEQLSKGTIHDMCGIHMTYNDNYIIYRKNRH